MKKLINKQGFTIVELVIVIAVIAILAAVLIPTFSNVITSANETATLQEAKNSLDSYVGLMSSKGKSINNGTVFVVYDKDSTATNALKLDRNDLDKISGMYVYYAGGLHAVNVGKTLEKEASDIPNSEASNYSDYTITIDSDTHAVNYKIDFTKLPEFSGQNDYTFYFYNVPLTFNEGSAKCRIYGGRIIANKVEYSSLKLTLDNDNNGTLTENSEGAYTLKVKANTSASEAKTIIIKATSTPAGGSPEFKANGLQGGLTLSNNVLTIAANTSVPESNEGTITVTLNHKGSNKESITLTIKVIII